MSLIGTMTYQWAGIDLILNHVIAWHISQTNPGSNSLPRDITRKLRYLKENIESDARIAADQRDRIRLFRIEITRLNKFRKSVVHGRLFQKNRLSVQWFVHSVHQNNGALKQATTPMTNDEILAGVRDIGDVAHAMSPFFAKLIGLEQPGNKA